jgi:hypothetical protein
VVGWRHPVNADIIARSHREFVMRVVDLIAGTGLLVVVAMLAFVVIPAESSDGVWHGLSPYFYPAVMLTGIAASSVGLIIQAAFKKQIYADQPNPISWWQLGCFSALAAIILACVLIIDWFGLWLGGPALIAATMIYMGERKPLRIVIVGLAAVAVVHIVVTYGLSIPLP